MNNNPTPKDLRKKWRWIALLLKLLQLLSQWLQTAKTALCGTASNHQPMGLITPPKTTRTNPAKTTSQANPTKTPPYAPKSVNAPAVVTFGPRSYEPLSRSQLLSLLRSDCLGMTAPPQHSRGREHDSQLSIDSTQPNNSNKDTDQIASAAPSLGRAGGGASLIVLHCTDTKPTQSFTIEKLIACHKARGFGPWPGYHLYVRRDGTLYYCRPVSVKGCHVAGHNIGSLGICYEGGHSDSPEYKYEDNRTAEQLVVLDELLRLLLECFPKAKLMGHNELAAKACPCFDVPSYYAYLQTPSAPHEGGD